MKDTATATADRLGFFFCSGLVMVRSMTLRKVIHIDTRQDHRSKHCSPRSVPDRTDMAAEAYLARSRRPANPRGASIWENAHGDSQADHQQLAAADILVAKRFYLDALGIEVLMDHGWIATYGSQQQMTVQIGVATEGGSGTSVPDLSIEVDQVDPTLQAMKASGFP
jgi:hypothetical protein